MVALKGKLQKGTKKIIDIWNDTDRYYKAEWAVLSLILLFCYLTMCYSDIFSTVYNEYHFWNAFFSKDIFFLRQRMWGSGYSLGFYFVFGIGMLPVWIAGHFYKGIDIVVTAFGLYWVKMYLALFLLLSCLELKKIAVHLGIEPKKHKWLMFFYASSLLVVLPVFHIAQCDIASVFFTIWGVRCFLEKKNKQFFIAFAIAIPMKLFALFVFIPLVLMQYKKVYQIIYSSFLGGSLVLFEKIVIGKIFPKIGRLLFERHADSVALSEVGHVLTASNAGGAAGEVARTSAENYVAWQFQFLNGNLIPIGQFSVSIVALAFIGVCIAAYMMKKGEGEAYKKRVIYVVFLSLLSFFLFSYSWNSYWIVIFAPYLVLVMFMNEKLLGVNCILELVFSVGLVIQKMIHQPWVFGGGHTYEYLLFKNMRQRPMNAYYLLEKFGLAEYQTVIYGLAVACVLGLAVINMPALRMEERAAEIRFSRTWIWARLAALLIFIAAGIDCVFFE